MKAEHKRNLLLIVPHQDDELLVGGAALYQFAHAKDWDTYVLFTTEGAALHEKPEIRMKEAISALKVIGVPKKNIIFLGYGNEWKGDCNIYNAVPNKVLTSLKGKQKTFALREYPEYCYQRDGVHHEYTRENYKNDLMRAILEIDPEVIMAVDMDDHSEHMSTSLFLDECLEEILKKEKTYCPLLLKKFAYDGLWKGRDDYFTLPRVETLNAENRGNLTRNPCFQWDERIRFAVPKECNTFSLFHNILYRAVKKHMSQTGWLCSVRLINSDIVYWCRRTDNLILHADIKVSSGNPKFLNDFKIIDTLDVRNKNTVWENCSWFPLKSDTEKKITIFWKEKVLIKQLVIYESPENDAGKIKDISIKFDDGYEFQTGELKHNAKRNDFILKVQHRINRLELKIIRASGKVGISEIEAFSETFSLKKFNLPLKTVDKSLPKTEYTMFEKMLNHIEYKLFHLKARVLLK